MTTKLNEDKIKIVCNLTRKVGGGKDIGYGSEMKEKDASCFVKSKESKEKMPPREILQIDRVFFHVFTRRIFIDRQNILKQFPLDKIILTASQ